MDFFIRTVVPMIAIFCIFYFIVIRPQNKKRQNHQNQLDGIKKGDKVITAGGLKGTVKDMQGKEQEILVLDVGSGTNVNVLRNYIISVEKK